MIYTVINLLSRMICNAHAMNIRVLLGMSHYTITFILYAQYIILFCYLIIILFTNVALLFEICLVI